MAIETGPSPAGPEKQTRRVPSWLVVFAAFLAAVVGVIVARLVLFGFAGNTVWDYRFAGKTVWNYLDVFLVPVAVALVTVWLTLWENRRQRKYEALQQRLQQQAADIRNARELEVENQRAQDEALQTYLDQMGDLLLREKLRQLKGDADAKVLARARTLTILARLNGERKRSVVLFLYEAGLITAAKHTDPAIIDLAGADLRGADLHSVNLSNAHFRGATLRETNLAHASLRNAYLGYSDLTDANLSNAHLESDFFLKHQEGATFVNAVLTNANLSGVDLKGVYFGGAHLEGANLTGAYLRHVYTLYPVERLKEQAGSLKHATMPDGQKYEDWLKNRSVEDGNNE